MLLFRFRFPGSSPSFRPGFPCLLFGSVYSAFCQFPFVLPCFAPTAVPQVIAWRRFFRHFALALSPSFPLSFVRFSSGSHYSASVSSFPFFPFLPHGGFPGAFIRVPFRLFPYFRFRFGTQPCCDSFHRLLFRFTAAFQQPRLLPFGFRLIPLS